MRIKTMLALVVTALIAMTSSAASASNGLTILGVQTALDSISHKLAPQVTGDSQAQVRTDGTIHFATPDAGDIVISLPGSQTIPTSANGSQIYLNDNHAVVARAAIGGAQVLLVAANKSAPINYQFRVHNGFVAGMPDGGLLLLDRSLRPARVIPAPWALDSMRMPLASSYTVSSDHTMFTQAVVHTVAGVSYPVVADPYVSYQPILSWPGNQKIGDRFTVYFDRFETANIAGTGAGVASALLTRAGIPAWVAPIAVGVARQAAYQSGKCATLQFDLYWGWLPYVSTWVRNC